MMPCCGWKLACCALGLLALPACTTLARVDDNPPPATGTTAPPIAAPAVPVQPPHDPDLIHWDALQTNPAAALDSPSSISESPMDWPGRLDVDLDVMWQDYRNFYSPLNLLEVGAGIGAVAPLANTRADESFRRWYQRRVHQAPTINAVADIFSYSCEVWEVIPAVVEGMNLAGYLDDDYAHDGGLGEWSNRSARSLAIGTPTLLATYVLLGAGRPSTGDSHWHPFQDVHGASGHTFFGAIPFLTAAEMSDNPFWQVPWFLGSFATGWSRIHKDQHYLSQVVLGWWLAYLSVRRVNDAEDEHRAWTLSPMTAEGPGIGLEFHY